MKPSAIVLTTHDGGLMRRITLIALAVASVVALVILAVLASTTLLSAAACAQPAPERFTLDGGRIDISNLAGAVRIVPGTGSSAVVLVTRGGRDASRLRINPGRHGDRATLCVAYPGRQIVYPANRRSGPGVLSRTHTGGKTTVTVGEDGCLGHGDGSGLMRRRVTITNSGWGFGGIEAWADLELRMPRGCNAILRLGVGEVRASNVEGDLTIDVASAPVHVEGTRGPLCVDTGSGAVVLRDVVGGDILVDTGSGHVEIGNLRGENVKVDTGSGGVDATGLAAEELVVDTGSGGVTMADVVADEITVDTGSGGVRLELTGSPRSLLVDTGSGGVTIRGPENLDASVEVDTGSGGVQIDYPMTVMSRSHDHIEGRIGSGRGSIRVDAGSGSVRLIRR